MLYLVHFEQTSHKTKQLSQKSQLQILKTEVFGKKLKHFEKKNSSFLRKNSSFLAWKLNEPVVTNYTRYHKSVEKKSLE